MKQLQNKLVYGKSIETNNYIGFKEIEILLQTIQNGHIQQTFRKAGKIDEFGTFNINKFFWYLIFNIYFK